MPLSSIFFLDYLKCSLQSINQYIFHTYENSQYKITIVYDYGWDTQLQYTVSGQTSKKSDIFISTYPLSINKDTAINI